MPRTVSDTHQCFFTLKLRELNDLGPMNNSKTSVHEAKNCEMIAGTGNTEQMSLIIAFFRVQYWGRHTKET